MVDLSTTVGGIPFSSCVYNASGPRTGSSFAMSKIAASASGGVLAKSATLVSQTGNELPRTWHEDDGKVSLNSEGLPNNGIDYYIDQETISHTMGNFKKPYMVSISGKTLNDNLEMLGKISDVIRKNPSINIAAVELNLACPNIVGKPTIGYDFDQMEDVLQNVSSLPCFSSNKPLLKLGIKMPPYFDHPHFEQAAAILNSYKHCISYVASINTIGNALAIDYRAEMPAIRAKGGFAGLSGPAVKYTALANVKKMRELLDDSIDVVGVGGVSSGIDAFEMILAGATAVQVGTCHWKEGPSCFDRICVELSAIMEEKGYTSIHDFRGKLKEWSKEGAALSRSGKCASKNGSGTNSAEIKRENDTNSFVIALLLAIIAFLVADKFNWTQL